MGMFDSVFVTCPDCGSEIEFQSKGGECLLREYTDLCNIPIDVANGLNSIESCSCGLVCKISVPETIIQTIGLHVEYLH